MIDSETKLEMHKQNKERELTDHAESLKDKAYTDS